MINATICPATVAAAAPATPQPNTKMQIGSKIMLKIAPTPCVNMV